MAFVPDNVVIIKGITTEKVSITIPLTDDANENIIKIGKASEGLGSLLEKLGKKA